MSDSYFDADRAAGTYPRKGYGWLSEAEKRVEITLKLSKGWAEPWVLKEARRMGIPIPDAMVKASESSAS